MNVELLNIAPFSWNLALSWIWIFAGFASGAALGLKFHQPDWLGGYGSWKRRLYRLAHISFFGTGILNLMFFVTVSAAGLEGMDVRVAAWGFLVGAFAMPIACVVAAARPAFKSVFYLPVIALLTGGLLTCQKVIGL